MSTNRPHDELPVDPENCSSVAVGAVLAPYRLFGVEDSAPSPEHVAELDAELTRLGKPHEFHSYANAGHGFFGVDRPTYRIEAANEGWQAIWAFFSSTLRAASIDSNYV